MSNKKKVQKIGTISKLDLIKKSRPRSVQITGTGYHLTKKDKQKKRSGREYEKQRKQIKNWREHF